MTDTLASIRIPGLRDGIPLLHIDDAFLVLDKPAGLLTSPDRWDKGRPNLMGLLHEGIRNGAPWAKAHALDYVMNAHRLDFDTSGVLVLVRSHEFLSDVAEQFRSRTVKKTYLALVMGSPQDEKVRIDIAIGQHPNRPGIAVLAPNRGKPAATNIEVVERYRRHALVRAYPETGRMHQVRIHLKAAGCPIVADQDYGGRPLYLSEIKTKYNPGAGEERPLLGRQGLHAESIELRHPLRGERVAFSSPWPKDLAVAVKYLRKFAGGNGPRQSTLA
jgi:23S rRNA pseudouridine1911/1915/1917 synthase